VCLQAPEPYGPSGEANLGVTDRQLFYFPSEDRFVSIPFSELAKWEVVKVDRNSVFVSLRMQSGQNWKFDVFPQAGRVIKRWLRRSAPDSE
jgi:hypothetical protein